MATLSEMIGGRSGYFKTGFNEMLGANQQAFGQAAALSPYASGFLKQGQETFQPSINYWSKILSGDRGEINTILAPEISRISQNYEGAAKAGSQFAPMGGGRSQMMAEMPFQRGRDISSLLAGLRPQAAQQLSGIAAQLSAMGLDANQVINAILGGVGQRGAAMIGKEAEAPSMLDWAKTGAGIGKTIGGLIFG